MKHSYKEQIEAIKTVMNVNDVTEGYPELRSVLNDAASTIASLNLNPDIFDRVRDLEMQLSVMTSICIMWADTKNKEIQFEIDKAEKLLNPTATK